MFRFCLVSYFEAFSSEILSECGCERYDMSEIALITEMYGINRVCYVVFHLRFGALLCVVVCDAFVFRIAICFGRTYVGSQMSLEKNIQSKNVSQ